MDEVQPQNEERNLEPTTERTWYTRWRIIVAFFVAGVILILAVWFAIYFIRYVRAIRTGDIDFSEFAANLTLTSGTDAVTAGNRVNVSEDDDPSIGSENASIVIIGFEDFECPFCKKAFPIMRELTSRYPDDIRFVYRDFPNAAAHLGAQLAHEAGECADDQDMFWQMHDMLYLNQPNFSRDNIIGYARGVGLDMTAFVPCLDSGKYTEEVQKDYEAGIAAGVRGTPTWFVNGLAVPGVIPLATWEKLIKSGIK